MATKEKFEEAKRLYETANADQRYVLESLFPELAESEDEKIRKWLLNFVQGLPDEGLDFHFYNLNKEQIVAWLEKQGEQKPTDMVEPKFKVGDWITNGDYTWEVTDITVLDYVLRAQNGNIVDDTISYTDEQFNLWTIEDAKDGDVLYHKAENGIEYIVMSKGLNENNNIDSYFRYNSINGFGIDIPSVLSAKCDSITPATKEQRDLLFQKMKEAGYEWDAEKKELKKIKPFDEYEGLTDFERTLADICIGWIGTEIGWKEYIKDNADVLLKIAVEKFNSVQDAPFEQRPVEENKGNLGGISPNSEWSDESH